MCVFETKSVYYTVLQSFVENALTHERSKIEYNLDLFHF